MICDYCKNRDNCRYFKNIMGQPFLDLTYCFECSAPANIKENMWIKKEKHWKDEPVKISPVFWQDASICLPDKPADYFVIYRNNVEHSTLYGLAAYLPRLSGMDDAGWFDLPSGSCEVLYWAPLPSTPIQLEV